MWRATAIALAQTRRPPWLWGRLPGRGRSRRTAATGPALWIWAGYLMVAAAATAAFHPDRILVAPREPSQPADLARFHARQNSQVLRTFHGTGHTQVIRLPPGAQVQALLDLYRASGLVRFAEPDYQVSAAALFPSDPHFQSGTQWWLNNYGQNGGLPDADLDAPEAWAVRHDARDVVVAILDSGVRPTHEDLAAHLWRHPLDDSPGYNALTGQHDPWDDNGHGTHLAGILGAVANNNNGIAGVAWRVQIMACKFLDTAGNGYQSDAIACIDFARRHGAQILCLSWGGSEFSPALSNALATARADGLLVVAAAGNNAANIDLTPYYPASLALDHLVAVGASTRTDQRWSFSNYGARTVDLFAPGAAIFSTAGSGDTAYESRNGTSLATACVAGALALLRQNWPSAPADELIARLLDAVDPQPAFAGRCVSGGRLNLRKALDLPTIGLSATNAMAHVRVGGAPGHPYLIAASTNLSAWTPLHTNTAGADGQWVFLDQASTNLPARFYRAQPAP